MFEELKETQPGWSRDSYSLVAIKAASGVDKGRP